MRLFDLSQKSKVFTALFVIFTFAFIFSPYWHFSVTHYFLKYVFLLFFFIIGLCWAYTSSAGLKLPRINLNIAYLFFLYFMLYIVNYKFLRADIAYRGDEDFHINRILDLFHYLNLFWQQRDIYLIQNPLFWGVCFFLLFIAAYYLFLKRLVKGRRRKIFSRVAVGALLLFVAFSAAILFPENIFRDNRGTEIYDLLAGVLRYPFLSVWFQSVFVSPNIYGDISLYRIVPFLSVLFLASYLFYVFDKGLKNKMLSLAFSFVFSTVPTIFFYGNILYLEMPVFLLMLICVFNIETIVKTDFNRLKSNPIWYCLLLMGFLKESVLIFYLLIIIMRVSYRIYKRYELFHLFVSEIKLTLTMLTPVILFLLFRRGPEYGFYFKNLLNGTNFFVIGRSLLEQTGYLLIIAVFGFIYIARKKDKFGRTTFVLFAGIALFLVAYVRQVDILAGNPNIFIGYSRLNLFLMPMIFYSSYLFILSLKRQIQIALLLFIILSNIIYFPFMLDGVRKPNWGSPLVDAAEYTYPYDETVQWLSKHYDTEDLILLGQYYPYFGLRYYFEKYKFHPKTFSYPFGSERPDKKLEHQMLNAFFENREFPADVILYHSVNDIDLKANVSYGGKYKLVKRIQNSTSSIYIFLYENFICVL